MKHRWHIDGRSIPLVSKVTYCRVTPSMTALPVSLMAFITQLPSHGQSLTPPTPTSPPGPVIIAGASDAAWGGRRGLTKGGTDRSQTGHWV
jgi:hypothetical protein